jgi:hypothetical protein
MLGERLHTMTHELNKLDIFLELPEGTSRRVLMSHEDPAGMNKKLLIYGVILDHDGMVPKSQRGQWKNLMMRAGIAKRYWKDPDSLLEEQNIDSL